MARIIIINCLVFVLLLCAGCGGSGSADTNGTLSLAVATTDQTGGLYNVAAIATYTPPAGKVANGLGISMSAIIHTLNSTLANPSDKLYADSSGIVTRTYNITQTNGPIYVDITASTGGLAVSKSVTIPSLVSLTTSPTTVGFPATAIAGSQQTVTVSGGTAPYTAAMDPAHAGDMTINVNGSTITLTKRNNSGQTPIIGAELTISDNSGNSVTIPVGYN